MEPRYSERAAVFDSTCVLKETPCEDADAPLVGSEAVLVGVTVVPGEADAVLDTAITVLPGVLAIGRLLEGWLWLELRVCEPEPL